MYMYIIVWIYVDLYLNVHMDTQVHQVSFHSPSLFLFLTFWTHGPYWNVIFYQNRLGSTQFQAVHVRNGMFTESCSKPIVYMGFLSDAVLLYVLLSFLHWQPISLPPWWF